MARILVVDDEEGIRSFVAEALERDGHAVTQAPDGEAAWAVLQKQGVELLITDLQMPKLDGMGLLKKVREEQPEVEVIVLTAHGSVESAVAAMKAGAFDYLTKPVGSPAELRLLATRALERRSLLAFKAEAKGSADPELTFGAAAMVPVIAMLKKVAPTEATVLLTGESGTGKEVAARALHRLSARADGPFIAVNCAALTETLLESELFGHEKGAFTGAVAQRRGRIELAATGTFFLDEVGELAPNLQAKLLRVLQEKTFERVGGTRTLEADVRWIAATNRELTAPGFRQDLYHRLAVFPVHLPPLRERREDIVPLARVLVEQIGRELGRPGMKLGAEVEAQLKLLAWPGNVRELRNVLERGAILAEGLSLQPQHLLIDPAAAPKPMSPALTLEELEKQAIIDALAAEGDNRKRAAARLGIGLRTLYEKLKRYELATE
jgi:two-component system response regulator FlrC